MKKKFIIVIVVLVISACANEEIKNSKYKNIKIKDIENAQTIVMSKIEDFKDIIEKNKDILLFEKNDVSFFGYKKNETIYLIDNEGYNTIKDYNNGKKEGYKTNKDYYQAEKLNCNSSENYYEYKNSMFLSYEDYIEAKENGFLESNFANINLLYPLKYPEEKNIQIFEKYNSQYNSAFKYKKKTNKIRRF